MRHGDGTHYATGSIPLCRVPLNQKTIRADELVVFVEFKLTSARIKLFACERIFDNEHPGAVYGKIGNTACIFNRARTPVGIDAAHRDAPADLHFAVTKSRIENIGKLNSGTLETRGFDVGDIVADDGHGVGVGF